jgi:hypothetical protein
MSTLWQFSAGQATPGSNSTLTFEIPDFGIGMGMIAHTNMTSLDFNWQSDVTLNATNSAAIVLTDALQQLWLPSIMCSLLVSFL